MFSLSPLFLNLKKREILPIRKPLVQGHEYRALSEDQINY